MKIKCVHCGDILEAIDPNKDDVECTCGACAIQGHVIYGIPEGEDGNDWVFVVRGEKQ